MLRLATNLSAMTHRVHTSGAQRRIHIWSFSFSVHQCTFSGRPAASKGEHVRLGRDLRPLSTWKPGGPSSTPPIPRITAKEGALKLLGYGPYTAKKLTDKLLEKGHDLATIQAAISDLERVGLTGDGEYAEAYVRSKWRQQLWSPRKLQYEMSRLGLDPSDQKAALRSHFGGQGLQIREHVESWGHGGDAGESNGSSREAEAVTYCRSRLQNTRREEPERQRAKFYAWLQRRGFSFDEARRLYDACQQPPDAHGPPV